MKKLVIAILTVSLFSCEVKELNSEEKLSQENASGECVENIDPNIACIEIYDPVCGCNGKTYANRCFAAAAKIKVLYTGQCKK